MAECLKMIFPQWQGSGLEKDLYYSAVKIRDNLLPAGGYEEVGVSLDDTAAVDYDILFYNSIKTQLKKAADIVLKCSPKKILTIGGDCGVELAPVSYLNKLYKGDLAVIWLDAHGDLNTADSSLSKRFHGMPLRCLLGEGDKGIVSQCFSKLDSKQVVLAGCRDLDKPEEEYILRHNIRVLSVNDFDKIPEAISATSRKNLYIHLDLDVLEPRCFSAVLCPSDGGIEFETLIRYLNLLKQKINVVGMSVLEYKHMDDADLTGLREIIEFGCSI